MKKVFTFTVLFVGLLAFREVSAQNRNSSNPRYIQSGSRKEWNITTGENSTDGRSRNRSSEKEKKEKKSDSDKNDHSGLEIGYGLGYQIEGYNDGNKFRHMVHAVFNFRIVDTWQLGFGAQGRGLYIDLYDPYGYNGKLAMLGVMGQISKMAKVNDELRLRGALGGYYSVGSKEQIADDCRPDQLGGYIKIQYYAGDVVSIAISADASNIYHPYIDGYYYDPYWDYYDPIIKWDATFQFMVFGHLALTF